MTKNRQFQIRIPDQLYDVLTVAAEEQIDPPTGRTGPRGRRAELVRRLIIEGLEKRGYNLRGGNGTDYET